MNEETARESKDSIKTTEPGSATIRLAPTTEVPRQASCPSGGGWIVLSLYGEDEAWRRGRVVLMCHGFTGNRMECRRLFVRMARRLADEGLAVATFDYRGNGESSGEFEEMTVSSLIEDAKAAVDFLKERVAPSPLRLGVLGFSMGGLVASYLTRERPREIACVVLWAAVACSTRVLRGFLGCSVKEALDLYSFPLDRDGWRIGRKFLEELDRTCSSKVLAETGKPTLILHARDDKTVDVDNAAEFSKALTEAGVEHEVELLRRGGHAFVVPETEKVLFDKTAERFLRGL